MNRSSFLKSLVALPLVGRLTRGGEAPPHTSPNRDESVCPRCGDVGMVPIQGGLPVYLEASCNYLPDGIKGGFQLTSMPCPDCRGNQYDDPSVPMTATEARALADAWHADVKRHLGG